MVDSGSCQEAAGKQDRTEHTVKAVLGCGQVQGANVPHAVHRRIAHDHAKNCEGQIGSARHGKTGRAFMPYLLERASAALRISRFRLDSIAGVNVPRTDERTT